MQFYLSCSFSALRLDIQVLRPASCVSTPTEHGYSSILKKTRNLKFLCRLALIFPFFLPNLRRKVLTSGELSLLCDNGFLFRCHLFCEQSVEADHCTRRKIYEHWPAIVFAHAYRVARHANITIVSRFS